MSIEKEIRKSYRKIELLCRNKKPLEQLITALNEHIKLFSGDSNKATRYLRQKLQDDTNNEHRNIMISRIQEALEPNRYYAIQINQNIYDVSIPIPILKVNPLDTQQRSKNPFDNYVKKSGKLRITSTTPSVSIPTVIPLRKGIFIPRTELSPLKTGTSSQSSSDKNPDPFHKSPLNNIQI